MRDGLEDRLTSRLQALADTVDDELPTPVDLELRVRRHRRQKRAARRWSSLAVAAAIVTAVTTVAVVHGTNGHDAIRIATSPTTSAIPVSDSLQPGTVMLAAGGRYVQTLDAIGRGNATMVAAGPGSNIVYSRATHDHRHIWYLSLRDGKNACGEVVRADVDGRGSTIVTKAVSFDVSPDGSRLALYGGGDVAHGHCSPVKAGSSGELAVVDATAPAASKASTLSVRNLTSLRWSPDGSYLAAVSCPVAGCEQFGTIDVPGELGAPLTLPAAARTSHSARSIRAASMEFGPDGLYIIEGNVAVAGRSTAIQRIDRVDARAAQPVTIFSSNTWSISQIVPTDAGTYVVAGRTHKGPPASGDGPGLYRIQAGKLVLVRYLPDPADTLTSVTPLADGG
jgi:hypothetical protein